MHQLKGQENNLPIPACGRIVTTFWLRVQHVTSVKVASILIYFMLNSWRIFCKTYSRITVQIIHRLNDIGTEILVIRNTCLVRRL